MVKNSSASLAILISYRPRHTPESHLRAIFHKKTLLIIVAVVGSVPVPALPIVLVLPELEPVNPKDGGQEQCLRPHIHVGREGDGEDVVPGPRVGHLGDLAPGGRDAVGAEDLELVVGDPVAVAEVDDAADVLDDEERILVGAGDLELVGGGADRPVKWRVKVR